ncbi:MAG: hypothetical protein ACO2OV_05850 [Thermoproteota archaeon]|jgi:hypothetical protein
METKTRSAGIILILVGVLFLLISAGFALREYFTYKVTFSGSPTLSAVLSQLAAELLILVVKVAFLGILIAVGSVLLRFGIEIIKEKK